MAVAAFIGAWLIAGAWTSGYSPERQAISQLARVGAPQRPLMTAGFVIFGVTLPFFGGWLAHQLAGRRPVQWCLAVAGVATLGVAAFPLGAAAAGVQDRVHAGFAVAGYVGLAATPLFAARPLASAGHRPAAAVSLLIGVGSAAALAATAAGSFTGLFQRVGLTLVDGWLVAMAGRPRVQPTPAPVTGGGEA